jgi:hypothetical protein
VSNPSRSLPTFRPWTDLSRSCEVGVVAPRFARATLPWARGPPRGASPGEPNPSTSVMSSEELPAITGTPMSRLNARRHLRPLVLGAALLHLSACTDGHPTGPAAGPAADAARLATTGAAPTVPVASGSIATAAWSPSPLGFQYQGSFLAQVGSTGPGRPGVAAPQAFQLPAGKVAEQRARLLAASLLLPAPAFGSLGGASGGPASAARHRLSLSGAAHVQRSHVDGREIEIRHAATPGTGRPARSVTMSVDGVVTSVLELRSVRRGPSWVITEAVETFLAPDGRPSLVLHHELGRAAAPVGDLAAAFGEQVGLCPDSSRVAEGSAGALAPLAADGPCYWQQVQLYAAYAAWATAAAGLSAVIVACGGTVAGCAALPGALALYFAALAVVADAEAALEACLQQQRYTYVPGPSPGGGDSPDGATGGCGYYIIEISYDGGLTWHYLGTAPAC